MITQYTRLVVNKSDGSIEHCTSQDFPFADGWEPIEFESFIQTHEIIDFEIDTDYPDINFTLGVDQEMIRARKILENFEVVSGQPRLKGDADIADKVLRVSPVKPITETFVKAEMVEIIKAALVDTDSSEKELLDSMRQIDSTTPDNIKDLKTIQVIRIKKEVAP